MTYSFGYILKKKYIFIKYLNSGAFSDVWLVYDFTRNMYYVAKIINERELDTGYNEIKILRKINQELILKSNSNLNILSYVEIIDSDDRIIIIEEYQNMNLSELIYNYELSEDNKKILIELLKEQIIPVLDFLKSIQILHTDIKPENIFIKNLNIPFDESEDCFQFVKEVQHIKCKANKKNKEIGNLITKYRNIMESKKSDSEDSCDSDNSDYNVETDSDIASDYEEEDNINDFLEETLENILNPNVDNEEYKTRLNFSLEDCVFSLGDFGNAIDYSDHEELEKIKSQHYHDLQTRYYRHPNIIMRSSNILDTDYFAFEFTLKEVKNQSVFVDPNKTFGHTTDQEHLRLLINSDLDIKCTTGRKTELFFTYDPLTKKYYLNQ